MIMDLNLPECDSVATVFIEVYSARKTLHGSLDASVSTCEAHAQAAVDAIHAQRLTTFRRHEPLTGERDCGYVFDYTTRLGSRCTRVGLHNCAGEWRNHDHADDRT